MFCFSCCSFLSVSSVYCVYGYEKGIYGISLNLNKELKHSKRNVIINDEKQFLRSRKWDYLDSNKMNEINNKVELIYKKMNKKQLEALIKSIKRCNLEKFYDNFNPQELKNPIGTLSSLNYLIEKAIYFSNENN